MSFTPANPLGWGPNDPVTSAQLNHLDQNMVKAVDGVVGGAYDGPLTFSAATLTGTSKVDTTGAVAARRLQPSAVSEQTYDVTSGATLTIDLTLYDEHIITLVDPGSNRAIIPIEKIAVVTTNADTSKDVKKGARHRILFKTTETQGAEIDIPGSGFVWPLSFFFTSESDRYLGISDQDGMAVMHLLQLGTPGAPVFMARMERLEV